jgi:mRNA interferase RelE/StbE
VKYRVYVTPAALDMLREIRDRREQGKVRQVISSLADEPKKKGKALTGEFSGFRVTRAAGQRYRIIYTVEEEKVRVVVVAAGRRKDGDRKDIYSLVRKMFEGGVL